MDGIRSLNREFYRIILNSTHMSFLGGAFLGVNFLTLVRCQERFSELNAGATYEISSTSSSLSLTTFLFAG